MTLVSQPAAGLEGLGAAVGAGAVRAGELAPSQWMEACLAACLAWEPQVAAWSCLVPEVARAAARAADRTDWGALLPAPRLAGVPLAIKDVFNTREFPTAMGSDLWAGFEPGNDCRVVSRAKLLGAVSMGKTVTAEFAVHTPGSTKNPHSRAHIAGTSSTGSAVAVACGMAPVALGTQTAGSIVRPASYVGVLGFKPSFGLVPRTGVLKTCDTLDTLGWFARSVADLVLLFDALRVEGRDYPVPMRGLERARVRHPGGKRPWRVALARTHVDGLAQPAARAALEEWAHGLARRSDVEVAELDLRERLGDAHAVHRTIYHKSLAYYFKRELQRPEQVSLVLREIASEGQRIPVTAYHAATRRQRELERELAAALEPHDVLVTLSTAGEPPRWEEAEPDDTALIWTLCGAPSLSLPLFRGPGGLPCGLQLVGARFADLTLLDFARTVFPGTVEPLVRPRGS